MSTNNLNQKITTKLLQLCIINNEEASLEILMNKRQTIIQNHIKTVYPIKVTEVGGKQKYYTKLNPKNRNNNGQIRTSTREELEDKIVAYYLEIDTKNKTTVYDVLELALVDLEPLTASRHKQLFSKFLNSLRDIKIVDLSEDDIRRVLQSMIDDGISDKNFNNCVSTLNKINDYCVYNHISMINIREKISDFRKFKMLGKRVFVKVNKKETDLAFSEKETIEILKYILDNPDYHNLAIGCLLTTGLRVGELLALMPEDVDLEKSTLNISKMEKVKSYDIVPWCKDNSERTVFLNADAQKILSSLMELRYKEETENDYLFLNSHSDDGKLHLRALDNRLRKIQEILNLDEDAVRSPHDCRRTYASIQYLHDVDIKTIQAQLGHSKVTQTWDYVRDVVDLMTRKGKLENGCILA